MFILQKSTSTKSSSATFSILNNPCLNTNIGDLSDFVPNNVSTIMIYKDTDSDEEYVRMIKENINGRDCISLPGGKYEKDDEDTIAAAHREYIEETTDSNHPDNTTEFEYYGHMTISYEYNGETKHTVHHVMRTYDNHKIYSGPLANGETNYVAWVNVRSLLTTVKNNIEKPRIYIKYADTNKTYPLRGCMKDTLAKFI